MPLSRASVAHEPYKCCSRAMQVSNTSHTSVSQWQHKQHFFLPAELLISGYYHPGFCSSPGLIILSVLEMGNQYILSSQIRFFVLRT